MLINSNYLTSKCVASGPRSSLAQGSVANLFHTKGPQIGWTLFTVLAALRDGGDKHCCGFSRGLAL